MIILAYTVSSCIIFKKGTGLQGKRLSSSSYVISANGNQAAFVRQNLFEAGNTASEKHTLKIKINLKVNKQPLVTLKGYCHPQSFAGTLQFHTKFGKF